MDKRLELLKRIIESNIENAESNENSALRDESSIFWNGQKEAFKSVFHMIVALEDGEYEEHMTEQVSNKDLRTAEAIIREDGIDAGRQFLFGRGYSNEDAHRIVDNIVNAAYDNAHGSIESLR
jgi:hypothetical protein